MHKDIKIQNIFYLLSYAWDCVGETEEITLGSDNFKNTDELYSKLFNLALEKVFKQGFQSEYILVSDKIRGIKGKLDISKSLKDGSFFEGYTHCDFDEYSSDHKINRIIKTTLHSLIRTVEIDKDTLKSLKKYELLLGDINLIQLESNIFSSLIFNNQNKNLKFIIKICELIFYSSSPGVAKEKRLNSFLLSHSVMSSIFEKFLRNFYKYELKGIRTVSERLKWEIAESSQISFKERVPSLMTDITIDGPSSMLVIDAKFYKNALISRNDKKFKYRREHLSQLMEYLKISEKKYLKKSYGVLIYPAVNAQLNDFGFIEKFPILISTLDLNQDWSLIREKLISIYRTSQLPLQN